MLADAVRVSVDDVPRPPQVRYARGRDSPEGYYRDAVDHDALLAAIRRPAGPGTLVPCDGIFLLRPELRDLWDFSLFVTATLEIRLRRALIRDVPRLDSTSVVEQRYLVRYEPGQQLHRADADPERFADIVIDDGDPARPLFVPSDRDCPPDGRPDNHTRARP